MSSERVNKEVTGATPSGETPPDHDGREVVDAGQADHAYGRPRAEEDVDAGHEEEKKGDQHGQETREKAESEASEDEGRHEENVVGLERSAGEEGVAIVSNSPSRSTVSTMSTRPTNKLKRFSKSGKVSDICVPTPCHGIVNVVSLLAHVLTAFQMRRVTSAVRDSHVSSSDCEIMLMDIQEKNMIDELVSRHQAGQFRRTGEPEDELTLASVEASDGYWENAEVSDEDETNRDPDDQEEMWLRDIVEVQMREISLDRLSSSEKCIVEGCS
jgi:hypothetical protein